MMRCIRVVCERLQGETLAIENIRYRSSSVDFFGVLFGDPALATAAFE
jgi:hypothetical protein